MANTLINPLYPRPHIAKGTGTPAAGKMLAFTTSSATAFTAGMFDTDCQLIVFDIQGSGVCFTVDGSTPAVGTTGHLLAVGSNYTWQLAAFTQAKFIGNGATGSIYASQWSM